MVHRTLTVVVAGVATTVQDHGRAGLAALGVPRSGAVDAGLHDLVNRLVGNPLDAATLETAGGLVVTSGGPIVIAASGEDGPRSLTAGQVVHVDPAPGEQWAYLAVRGGIAVDPVLGSRSRDTLSGLGPLPPRPGAELPVGADPGTPLATDNAPRRIRTGVVSVRIWAGPRADWFDAGAIGALMSGAWAVSRDVSRVGVRLDGPLLARRRDELPSEPLVLGAIQVPPDGRPVVMLPDHPTTGGYPVIGVVDAGDVGSLAQARPGTAVRMVTRSSD